MAEVALLRCEEYSPAELKAAIHSGMESIGFPLSSFRSARVALKPNLLSAVPGMRKSQMHLKCPDSEEFSHMILDLVLDAEMRSKDLLEKGVIVLYSFKVPLCSGRKGGDADERSS